MMREYRVWRHEEEAALRAGVLKHGTGAWEVIRTDPEYNSLLKGRTGVQLKDKWRNLVKFRHLTTTELGCLSQNATQKVARKTMPADISFQAAQPASAPLFPSQRVANAKSEPSPSAGASDYERSDGARDVGDAGPSTSAQPAQSTMSVSELLQHIRDYHGRKKAQTQDCFQTLTKATEELTDALRNLSESKAAQKRLMVAEQAQKQIKDEWMALTEEVSNAGIILSAVQDMYQNNDPIQLNSKEEEMCPAPLRELIRAAQGTPPSVHLLATDTDTPPLDGRARSLPQKRAWTSHEDRRYGIYDQRRYHSPGGGDAEGAADLEPAFEGLRIPRRMRTSPSNRPAALRNTRWGLTLGVGAATAALDAADSKAPHASRLLSAAAQYDRDRRDEKADLGFEEGDGLTVHDFVDDLHRHFSIEDWEMAELAVRALDGLSKGDGPGLSGTESQHQPALSPLMTRSPEHDGAVSSGLGRGAVGAMAFRGGGLMSEPPLPLERGGGDPPGAQGAQGGGSGPPRAAPGGPIVFHQAPVPPAGAVATTAPSPLGPGHVLVYPQLVYPPISGAHSVGLEPVANPPSIVDAAMRPTAQPQQPRYVMTFPSTIAHPPSRADVQAMAFQPASQDRVARVPHHSDATVGMHHTGGNNNTHLGSGGSGAAPFAVNPAWDSILQQDKPQQGSELAPVMFMLGNAAGNNGCLNTNDGAVDNVGAEYSQGAIHAPASIMPYSDHLDPFITS